MTCPLGHDRLFEPPVPLLILLDLAIEDEFEGLEVRVQVDLICEPEGKKVELGVILKKPISVLHIQPAAEFLVSLLRRLLLLGCRSRL